MIDTGAKPNGGTNGAEADGQASIGTSSDGNPDVRHDGVALSDVTAGGPADQAGIRAGDLILAINDHYLFTIRELKEEISHHQPGTRITVRYRRFSSINDTSLVVGEGTLTRQAA